MNPRNGLREFEQLGATVFLVARHAQKIPGRHDHGLSPRGVSQAIQLAKALMPWQPKKLFSSPYPRAVQTASIVGDTLGLQSTSKECLIERRLEPPAGTGTAGFKAEWAMIEASRDYEPTIGEASRSAGERLESCLSDIAKSSPGARIAVITHGGILRDFFLNLAERRPQDRHLFPEPFPASAVPHARVAALAFQGGGFIPIFGFPVDQPCEGK